MKKLIAIFLCIVTLFTVAFPVYASSITPYSNNIYSTNTSFSISSTGYATVSNNYMGKQGLVTKGTIVTKVQKKYGLIWITVDGGKWTDTSAATSFSQSHSVQLSSKGTYRAYVEFTISGTGGSDDKITKNVEKNYS